MVVCIFLRTVGRLPLGAAEIIEFVGEPSPEQTAVLVFLILAVRFFWGWQAQIIR